MKSNPEVKMQASGSFRPAGGGHAPGRGGPRGFTLIELLTVISIIGVIAALMIGVGPAASRMMKVKKVQGEMHQIASAIDSFKATYGHYPLDNRNPLTQRNANSGTNQLYYELVGAVYDATTRGYVVPANQIPVSTNGVQKSFGTLGFENSSDNPSYKNFIPNLKPSQYALFKLPLLTANDKVVLLVTGLPGAGGPLQPNPWHYVSSFPTHNPETYDLWAEVIIGKTPMIIGNWKQ